LLRKLDLLLAQDFKLVGCILARHDDTPDNESLMRMFKYLS
jgi:hypothetical protein